MKLAPMAIPAVALLQQHDARRDILIEPVACSNRSSGHSELEAKSGRKNQPACTYITCCGQLYCLILAVYSMVEY